MSNLVPCCTFHRHKLGIGHARAGPYLKRASLIIKEKARSGLWSIGVPFFPFPSLSGVCLVYGCLDRSLLSISCLFTSPCSAQSIQWQRLHFTLNYAVSIPLRVKPLTGAPRPFRGTGLRSGSTGAETFSR